MRLGDGKPLRSRQGEGDLVWVIEVFEALTGFGTTGHGEAPFEAAPCAVPKRCPKRDA